MTTAHLTSASGCLVHLATSGLLSFGSDVGLRTLFFSRVSFAHSAKLHLGLLCWLVERYTRPGEIIAYPTAGVGPTLLAASLQRHVIACEIEPCWHDLLQDNAKRIRAQTGLLAGQIDIGHANAREP